MSGATGDAGMSGATDGAGVSGAGDGAGMNGAADHEGDGNDIDRYLDRLLLELRGSAADVRRVLAEVEEHLNDATREGVADGLAEDEARRAAIARFGSPRTVARRFGGAAVPHADLVRALAWAMVLFGAVGLVAIGVSGTISELLGRLFGASFVSGDLPWVRYTPGRCAELRSYFPGRGCLDAAVQDHWGEVVVFRVAAGVLGLLVLGGYALVRRRARASAAVLRPGVVPVAGVTAYGLAALVLAGEGANAVLLGGVHGGSGQWWSAAVVALAVALAYARSAYRVLLERS